MPNGCQTKTVNRVVGICQNKVELKANEGAPETILIKYGKGLSYVWISSKVQKFMYEYGSWQIQKPRDMMVP